MNGQPNRTRAGRHKHGRQTGNALREVKFKIELPGRRPWRVFPLFIHKGESQLDYLEQIHIASQ